nr:ABC transporter permease [Microbacterium resistens]
MLRGARMLGVLLAVSVLSFLIVDFIPGDPAAAVLGSSATPEQIAQLHAEMGLDRPPVTRYVEWLAGVVTGDFGMTLIRPIEPVVDVVGAALPVTVELTLLTMLLSLVVGVPLGAWAAARSGTRTDTAITLSAFAALAIPVFVMGVIVIRLFVFLPDVVVSGAMIVGGLGSALLVIGALRRRVPVPAGGWALRLLPAAVGILVFLTAPEFPRQGWVRLSDGWAANLQSAFLPALTLALGIIPVFIQLLRVDMAQTLQQDFILIARAKGLSEQHVVVREALRPSLFSLVTVAGLVTGGLLGGSVVVETMFGLPGLGRVIVQAIQAKNYPVVQVGVLVVAAIFLAINVVVDIAYHLLEPRIRRAHH